MTNDISSIFDKDFSGESAVRRRDIMPLALRIYAWVFMVSSIYSLLGNCFRYIRYPDVFKLNEFSLTVIFSIATAVLLPLIRFLPNLLILLEKKYAILLSLVAVAISILVGCYSSYISMAHGMMGYVVVATNIFWLLVDIPYLMILLRIRKDWEKGMGRPQGI
ncbi:hypothetical protein QFZ51_004990 [Chitinophaga sp. W3I9]|uniref:hypothetical protein n=1 Tax=unclassified Chitinophaga TaxID=2619133 RepID=UPI003D1F9F1A